MLIPFTESNPAKYPTQDGSQSQILQTSNTRELVEQATGLSTAT